MPVLILLLMRLPAGAESPTDESFTAPVVHAEITATTPSRLEEPLEEIPGSVSVLSEPAIEAQQPVAVPELLRDLPGVDLFEGGTLGEASKIRMRGAEPDQTMVMLDGIRINGPFRGEFDLGEFLIDSIAQIEVVRGAYSALYGSDAIGGVVNFRTRIPQRPLEISLFSSWGTFYTAREGISVAGRRDWGHYSLNVSRTDSNGQFDNDRFGATTLSGQVRLNLTPSSYLMVTPRYQESKKELAITPIEILSPLPFVPDENNRLKRRFVSTVVEYRNTIRLWWDIILKGSTVETDLDWDNPITTSMVAGMPVSFFFFEETRERQWTIQLQQNFTWWDRQIFTIGLEHGWINVHSNVNFNGLPGFPVAIDGRRRTRAAYAQQLFKWRDEFVLQVGVRADGDTRFGSTVNPKVSTSYEFPATLTKIRGSWGMGYRAPTIQDLEFFFGNPNLDPETAQSWEIGLRQPVMNGRLVVDAIFFQIDFDDLIQIDFDPLNPPPTKRNISHARSRGVETEIVIQPISRAELTVNYTWVDTRAEGGAKFPFIRRHRVNIGVTGSPLTRLVLHADVNIVSNQKLPFDFLLLDGTVQTNRSSGYVRVDLAVTYELLKPVNAVQRVILFAKANNLLNRDYQDFPGFPAPGLNVLAGIKAYL